MFVESYDWVILATPNKLLVIIPAFNEEECIKSTVDELVDVAPDLSFIVINDGSTDCTAEICRENGYPMIDLPVNSGLTSAFQVGMKYAFRNGYQYAAQFDADGQHMPSALVEMYSSALSSGSDIVIGSRFVDAKKDFSPRMIGSRLISFMIKLTTRASVTDPTSGLRLFNRKMIERFATDRSLNPEPESIAYLIRKGASVSEIQCSMRERQAGESYLTFSKSISYMIRACSSILFVQWFR